jgi:DNA-binding IclR family transcriptional regulator
VLVFMLNTEAAPSVSAIAEHLGFKDRNGKPLKSKAHRILKELKKHRLVTNERGESYALNEKGKEVAKKAAYNQKAKGASYG